MSSRLYIKKDMGFAMRNSYFLEKITLFKKFIICTCYCKKSHPIYVFYNNTKMPYNDEQHNRQLANSSTWLGLPISDFLL